MVERWLEVSNLCAPTWGIPGRGLFTFLKTKSATSNDFRFSDDIRRAERERCGTSRELQPINNGVAHVELCLEQHLINSWKLGRNSH